MRKYFISLVILLLFLFSIGETKNISADVGPKPSLIITVIGIDEPYYFDLLCHQHNIENIDQSDLDFNISHTYSPDNYPNILIGYQDEDDFASYSLYSSPNGMRQISNTSTEQVFEMDYYPPTNFKIVLVTENDVLIVSETLTRIAFNTVITYDLSGVDTTFTQEGVGETSGNIDSKGITFDTIIRTVLRVIYTLIIEIGILYLFKYRKKQSYVKVGVTNLVTQLSLSFIVIYTAVYSGLFFAFLLLVVLEVIVLAVESGFYILILDEHSKKRAILYAFIANLSSFLIGYLLLTSI